VTCTPFGGKDDIVPDPIVVIEVISPSTEREDRGRKKFDYFATPSIQQYAIIEPDARRVDLYTRSGDRWTDEIIEGDATLKLSSIGVEITLDAIYEDTELDATQLREDGRQAPAL
jgi:Uma2 family endonuclease